MIHITRHAQSISNAGFRVESQHHAMLSELGIAQACELATQFCNPPDMIILSDTPRNVLTAAPLLEKFPNVPVEFWPVHEFYFINNDKMKNTIFEERKVLLDEYFARNDPDFTDGPECESFNQFIARVQNFIRRLDRSKNILIISHGHFINGVLMVTKGLPLTVQQFSKMQYIEHAELIEI